ncbi:MAG TPA: permease prefix domain 1-containing protein, partial [Pyrinomonadaceae bacterium]
MTFNRISKRVRALFRKNKLEQELDAELRFHLERLTAQNLQSGMSPEHAHYSALKTFGKFEQSKEECRDARGVRWIDE